LNGTIAVYAKPPAIGRAGLLWVVIDGERVGQVKQGEAGRFPVPVGPHTVRTALWDRSRSNTVTVEVAEGKDSLVTVGSTGLRYATLLAPILGVLLYAIPGALFWVRVADVPEPAAADPVEPAVAGEQSAGGSGLWWESDPALAKRFRKNADA
jgi:hypothetical protein